MKELSDKIKNKIVEECFEDVCEDAQKEETGAFKGFVNQVIKPRVCLLQDRSVVVIDKKHKLSVNYIYKLVESKKRVQILEKIEEPFIYIVKLNDEQLSLQCDQYHCNLLD